ncbi:MAG: bifunctional folylpolyglutamate synthase/dihydrofolate synthase [Planctomycetota bacterium]|jgi:dihydrofolate synthase/folylpolyglutamate synthase
MSKSRPAPRKSQGRTTTALEITTYPSAVRYLLERTNLERMRVVRYDEENFKLDRMRTLLEHLGNPHEQVRMVHVAGTVGKGSTVAMIASMLQGCGYAVGRYTSPHLVEVRERIAINDDLISRPRFTELMRQVAEASETLDIAPTFFETVTAMAFMHFAEEAVDIAVIETGLGGRLDSTNVITPEVSIITQIDRDHTHILGRSVDAIAREKAGIFKRGVPAITFEQSEEVDPVLQDVAESVESPLRVINKDIEFSYRFCASPDLGPHTRVCLITETSQFMHLPVPLPGEHQAINCGLALAAIDALKASGFKFEEVPLHEGLARTTTPGRMEIVWSQPRILIDGAHNAASLGALVRCVGAHVPYDSMVCIFGCCEDKDVAAMLEKIAMGGDKIIFTRARTNPRAADPDELQRRFQEISGKMSQVARTLPEALDLASRAVGRDDLICVTGSFYLAGEAKKYLADMEKKQQAAATR